MKSILMSIRPQHVANILNKIKTLEIRKRFPSDYVGWVYIYCTKDRHSELCYFEDFGYRNTMVNHIHKKTSLNAKVIARFWCDKVEEILVKENGNFYTNFLSNRKLLTQSCLANNELRDYMAGNWKQRFYSYWYGGYAIHITNLEIFDKPKEIDFYSTVFKRKTSYGKNVYVSDPLTRAPQSFMFIEV